MGEVLHNLHTRGPVLPAGAARTLAARLEHCPWPLPNVWLGTSIESDEYSWRANDLRETPAAVRFLSLEPLLGPLPSLDLTGVDWVIAGGSLAPRRVLLTLRGFAISEIGASIRGSPFTLSSGANGHLATPTPRVKTARVTPLSTLTAPRAGS